MLLLFFLLRGQKGGWKYL